MSVLCYYIAIITDSNNINFEVCHRVLSKSAYALLSLIQAMLYMSTYKTGMSRLSRFENLSMAVSTKSWMIIVQQSCMA